jgi:hypothetical protein
MGNSETFTSPRTPSSSKILFDTNVRLGTQNIDISCSTEPFFCNFLICSAITVLATFVIGQEDDEHSEQEFLEVVLEKLRHW